MTLTPQKAATAFALIALLGFGAVSCSATPAAPTGSQDAGQSSAPEKVEEKPEPVDLSGEWKQTNSNSPDSFQTATIADGTIEVNWNGTDMKALYWAGTVEVPQDGTQTFSWDSANDTAKTDGSMMASSDATKTFTYADGELSYDVTAMGTTMTVRLVRQ